jgi:branched-subunit amino acid ABC-type transport system permease component
MFEWLVVGQILWTSLATTSYYVLFAVAFALVLKVNRFFNFAQAGVMTAAFYTAHAAVQMAELPGWAAFLLSLLAALLLSTVIEVFGFATLRTKRATVLFVFIFTLVVSQFVAYVASLLFGTWTVTIFTSMFYPVTLVGEVAVSAWDVPAMGAALGSLAVLFAFLRLTPWGQAMLAVADNPDLAELYGIKTKRVYLLAMLIAGALVTVGMFLYGSRAQVQPMTSLDLMLFATVATILGGIGNVGGAAIAAVVLGLIQNTSILIISSQWQGFLVFAVLFVAIVFFPQGVRLPERRARADATRQTPPAATEQEG